MVANVDQVVIVIALKEPELKQHLIDRYLASAAQGGIEPIICLNKADLIDPVEAQSIVGYYSQLGIPTILTSATTGLGIERLRRLCSSIGRPSSPGSQASANRRCSIRFSPNSGCGSARLSEVNQKGRPYHDDSGAPILLTFGGFGLRHARHSPVRPVGHHPGRGGRVLQRVSIPYVPLCGFPDCTHTHEEQHARSRTACRAPRYLSEHAVPLQLSRNVHRQGRRSERGVRLWSAVAGHRFCIFVFLNPHCSTKKCKAVSSRLPLKRQCRGGSCVCIDGRRRGATTSLQEWRQLRAYGSGPRIKSFLHGATTGAGAKQDHQEKKPVSHRINHSTNAGVIRCRTGHVNRIFVKDSVVKARLAV